ncbi:MAG: hypothetical protein ACRCYP_06200 [Alphaproteobacteria bacterium]
MWQNYWIVVSFLVISSMAVASSPEGMEQCRVVSADKSVGLIKAGEADGIGSVGIGNPHKGLNIGGEVNAYIWVPSGMCAKINAGHIKDIPEKIRDKIYLDGLPREEQN